MRLDLKIQGSNSKSSKRFKLPTPKDGLGWQPGNKPLSVNQTVPVERNPQTMFFLLL